MRGGLPGVVAGLLAGCAPGVDPVVEAHPSDLLGARVVAEVDGSWGADVSLCSGGVCREARGYSEDGRLAVPVLGMLPDRLWDLDWRGWPSKHRTVGRQQQQAWVTDPLPPDLEAKVTGRRQTPLCTRMASESLGTVYGCVDGEGRFRSLVEQPWMMRSGSVATTEEGEVVWTDPGGDTTAFRLEDLTGLALPHERFDRHAAQVLDGGWHDGAVAALTRIEDTAGDETFAGAGIVVFDPGSGEVLWEWSAHGTPGDGVPLDGLDYARRGEEGVPPGDWFHPNALVHTSNGAVRFWLSSRTQSQLYEIDVEGGEIETVVGFEGDLALTAGQWFFQQHGLEVRGTRAAPELWLFDNGNVRADDADGWSRAVGYRMDRAAGTLEQTFTWAGPQGPGSRFTRFMGDVVFVDDTLAVLWSGPSPLVEGVDLDSGAVLWTLELPGQVQAYALEPLPLE